MAVVTLKKGAVPPTLEARRRRDHRYGAIGSCGCRDAVDYRDDQERGKTRTLRHADYDYSAYSASKIMSAPRRSILIRVNGRSTH